jgi:hypothetical protein
MGVVNKTPGYLCPSCDGFLEHVRGEGDLWCDECEESVPLRGKGELGVNLWQTLPTADKTGWTLPEPACALPASCPRGKACIQFVGGDRGGAGRPLVMNHREDKAIRDAVGLGSFREGFTFADSLHAASVDDLIGCHRVKPGVMHFVGHGADRELILIKDRDLMTQTVTLDLAQLVDLFRAYPERVRLVFFNTCNSAELAKGLTDSGAVDLAIGVPGQVADDMAVDVARTFYRQLAEGMTVHQAFVMAMLHVKSTAGACRHELFTATGIDARAVSFGW